MTRQSDPMPSAQRPLDRGQIALLVALISWGMFFLTLFMTYAVYRFSNPVWPPAGQERLPLFAPTISTFFVFLASMGYEAFQGHFQRHQRFGLWYWATLVSGVLFVLSQLHLWAKLDTAGLYVSSGIFASILHGFTWIHAAHMGLAMAALLGLRFFLGSSPRPLQWVQSVGRFWHFLSLIWIIMFVTLFVI